MKISVTYRFIILSFLLLFLNCVIPDQYTVASPLSEPVKTINVKQIKSLADMETCLNRLFNECVKAKQNGLFTFDFQYELLEKSGESINKIIELQKHADLSKNDEYLKFRVLFSKNSKILDFIRNTNHKNIAEIQEEKLDEMEDVEAFLASPQWQTPHRLISLTRYWSSWNEYYSSFLYPDDASISTNMLSMAIKGFSLTLTDIEERVMVIKALFGRALCFKELGKYEKAIRDFDSVIQKAKQEDPLYILSLFEKAQVNYKIGDFDAALDQLNELGNEKDQNRVCELLGQRHQNLRVKVLLEPKIKRILLDLKKEKNKQGENVRGLCRDGLAALNKLSNVDLAQISRLYRLTNEYAFIYKDYTNDELGAVACLGVADALFNDENYREAVKRYTYIWDSKHPLPRRRMDDIYLRSGYCYCQTGQWDDAIDCFNNLFNKFSDSVLLDKAACLQYLAASKNYEANPDNTNYAAYIISIKRYLNGCSDAKDQNGAHFQLGKYYHDMDKAEEATISFSAIEESSAYYWPAIYYLLEYNMAKLESLYQQGKGKTDIAKKHYQEISSQVTEFQDLLQRKEINPGVDETAAYMTILNARLLFKFGPEALQINALDILKGFENRFTYNHRVLLEAKSLRMSCYLKCNMFNDAQNEIILLDLKGKVNDDLWAFLNKWAGTYYKQAGKLREKADPLAGSHALTAAMIYEKLSDIATRKETYSKDLNGIQLRWAELLTDENQTAKAREIYIEYLKRNPNDAEALNSLGNIYEYEGQWLSALEIWRKFSKGLESGSEQWFEYRLRVIRAYTMMGRYEKACELISMTQVLHPNLKNEKLLDEMQELKGKVCIQ